MGIVKRLNLKKQTRARLELGRFYGVDTRVDGDVGSFNKAVRCCNVSVKDGTLKSSFGIKSNGDKYVLPDNEELVSVYYFKHNDYEMGVSDDRIIAYASSGKVYSVSVSGGKFSVIDGLTFAKKPMGVCYNYNSRDVIIFSAEGEGIKIYDGERVVEVPDAPSVTSMCIHSERLFITSGGVDGALWFSDDFDPTNWSVSLTEAGFIDMSDDRGEMLCAVAFGGHVYVFRSYGVSRVTAYSDQSEFSVAQLLVSCGKIYKDTVIVCGDSILFFASDGLYRFDGYSAVKISEPWFDYVKIDHDKVKGVYYNGYAYYLVKLKTETGEIDGVLSITPDGRDYNFSAISVLDDLAVMSGESIYKLFAIERFTSKIYEVERGVGWDGYAIPMEWQSKQTDFGIKARQKTIKRVKFYADTSVTLTITVGNKKYEYALEPKNGVCEVYPYVKGERFSIKLYALGLDNEISALEMEVTYFT